MVFSDSLGIPSDSESSQSSDDEGLFPSIFERHVDACPPLESIRFDPDSDLQLVVGEDGRTQDMFVDSRALCRASPVFRKMLRGSFVERQPEKGQDWVVRLRDDEPKAIATLCDLCHGQMELTRTSPTIILLYHIIVAADKYDMIQSLRPMATIWVAHCKTLKIRSFTELTQCLLIAWHLGDVGLFGHFVARIAKRTHVDAGGNFMLGTSCKLEDFMIVNSIGIVDIIKDQRAHQLAMVHRECRQLAGFLFNPESSSLDRSIHNPQGHKANFVDCQERMLGRLMMGAVSQEILPFFVSKSRPDTSMAVRHLLAKIENTRKFVIASLRCDPFKLTMPSIVRQVQNSEVKLSDIHEKYLKIQAAKTRVQNH